MLVRCCRVKACHVISQQTISFASSHLGWPISADSLCLGGCKNLGDFKDKAERSPSDIENACSTCHRQRFNCKMESRQIYETRGYILCKPNESGAFTTGSIYENYDTGKQWNKSLVYFLFPGTFYRAGAQINSISLPLFFISCTFLGAQRLTHFIPIWFGVCLRGSRLSWKLIQ